MSVPKNLLSLTTRIFLQVRPVSHRYLREWKQKAQVIPDEELRRQALMSISDKTFHCEGGAMYGLLAGSQYQEAIKFIVAYQTISDYLDNLCDRSTSLDPEDFRALHESMLDALTPDAKGSLYYQFRQEQEDGGYLASLVQTCQDVLRGLPNYAMAAPALHELAVVYCELQVHKHVQSEERLPRLQAWFDQHKEHLPDMAWYEFAACAGSTLGVFCIVAYLFNPSISPDLVSRIRQAYFPWVQGLHILLDYLIDQEEDRAGLDLNFCSYYSDRDLLLRRLSHFYTQAQLSVKALPDKGFHRLINRGLLSMYLSDHKVSRQRDVREISHKLLRLGGIQTLFFFLHCWIYRRLD